jgi:hypothetical protein
MPNDTQPTDCGTLFLRPVPADVKLEFKSNCAKFKVSMLDAQVEFMRRSKELLPSITESIKLRKLREKKAAAKKS